LQNHIFLYGESQNIQVFLNSLVNNKKFERVLFGLKKSKLIILTNNITDNLHLVKEFPSLYLCFKAIDVHCINLNDIVKINKKQIRFISLYDDEVKNIRLLNEAHHFLEREEIHIKKSTCDLRFYIQLNQLDNIDLYAYDDKYNSHITIYSYHNTVAYDVIMKNPVINHFSTHKHIVFIGFGMTNSSIYRYYLPDNMIDQSIKYTIITNDDENNLSHILRNINVDLSQPVDKDYLELPSFDAIKKNTECLKLNLMNADDYKNFINKIVQNSENIIYVAVGDDVKNLIITQQLLNSFQYQFKNLSFKIMTRLKNKNLDTSNLSCKASFSSFGALSDVYTYENIVNEQYSIISQRIHETLYKSNWFGLSYYDKKSSLFSIPCIRNKLRILGFDLSDEGLDASLKYYNKYGYNPNIDEWNVLDNLNDFDRYQALNIRNDIAKYEHLRWNIFMLLNGFTQMSLTEFNDRLTDETLLNPAKDLNLKKHICITTFDSLIAIAKIIEKYNFENMKNRRIDYILADYVVMDKLPLILYNTKYKIVEFDKEVNL
jgi:hypothetical protein